MLELFNSLNIDYDKTTEKNLLQRLGVMHLAAAIKTSAKCESNIGLSTFYNSIQIINRLPVQNAGLPADWAFTICGLFHLVHFDLIRKRRYEDAALLFNFIWKAYAYKLKEAKRIAFMANLFAGLHYDFGPDNKLHMIEKMGIYVLRKYLKTTHVPEYCVYVTVVWLCMADIKKQQTRDDQYLSVISQAKIESFSIAADLQLVWDCIKYYSDLISGTSQPVESYNALLDEIFHEGWRVAFGAHRFLMPQAVTDLRRQRRESSERHDSNRAEMLIHVKKIRFDRYMWNSCYPTLELAKV